MIYVMIHSQHAEQFSRSLARLMLPESLRDSHSVTDLYCGICTKDGSPYSLLVLPETETVPIHLQADGSELIAMLSVFVTDGALSQQEARGISGAVSQLRGQQVRIADFIPPSWAGNVLTEEQAIEQGFIATE